MYKEIRLKDIIAPHFWNIFNNLKIHNVIYGGRGSTKTSMIALNIVFSCISDDNCSAVILRRHQNLLRNSVYKEIKKACSRLGLTEKVDYTAYVSPMQIVFNNKNTIYFASGDDFETVKGMTDENKLIKKVWFEELTGWDDEDEIDQIIATFTRGNNSCFNAFYSYNPPKNRFHWVNLWKEKKKIRDDYLFSESDYRTVPSEWLGNIFIEEAERLKQYDEKRYRWIYLGEVIGIEGLIYNPNLFIIEPADYIEKNNLRILYIDLSIDCGHQTSATSCGAYGYATDGRWYRLDTYYYSPHEKARKKAPSELAQDLFDFRTAMCKKYNTTIDKETIDSAERSTKKSIFCNVWNKVTPSKQGNE